MKKYILALMLLVGFAAVAQEELNAYKYVVVPTKFDFQKKTDEHGINTLLKYKFQQLGFETYLDTEELPEELKEKGCSSISPVVVNKGGVFITKLVIEIKDCLSQVLFTTQEGKSKSKSYKISYHAALREALKSFDGYKLEYTPKKTSELENAQAVIHTAEVQNISNVTQFLHKGKQYKFMKVASVFHVEITDSSTGAIIGKISKSSKKGIYHVILNNINGIGYYDQAGNFNVEVIANNGSISVHRFQLVD